MSFCSVLAFIYSSLAVAVVGPTVRVLPVVYPPVVEGTDASADAILDDGVIGEATFPDVELTLSLVSRRRIGSCWLPSPDKFDEAYISHSSDPVGPGDVMGYAAVFDLLIPVLRIVWTDGSSSLEPLVNLRSVGHGVDRAISLMTATDWRRYWGPLIRLLPNAISEFDPEILCLVGGEASVEGMTASRSATCCDLILPVIRCQWGNGSHWTFEPLMNLSHRVDSIRQALGRMTQKDWATHWGSTLVKLRDVFSRL